MKQLVIAVVYQKCPCLVHFLIYLFLTSRKQPVTLLAETKKIHDPTQNESMPLYIV